MTSQDVGRGMQRDDETWAAVRRAYADPSVPLAEIAARFALTPQQIGARAKREGWPGREERARVPARKGKAPPPPAGSGPQAGLPTRKARRALIGRLYRAISLKLEHMEKRMASGEARSAQDEEREGRALSALISNFEKVTEAVAELDTDRDATQRAQSDGADAERMRQEIAERLERLGGVGAPRKRSRKPRP